MSFKDAVVEALQANPKGLTKEELIQALEAKLNTPVTAKHLSLASLALDGKVQRRKEKRSVKIEKSVTVYFPTGAVGSQG